MSKYVNERKPLNAPLCSTRSTTEIYLNFNGKQLKMTVTRKTDRACFAKSFFYKAVSGQPIKGKYDYGKWRQGFENLGPIPEGRYWINPTELWENGILKFHASRASWGDFRISLHPYRGTNHRGRGGFFIHGGTSLGSGGCIDLTGNMNRFVRELGQALNDETDKNSEWELSDAVHAWKSAPTCKIDLEVKYKNQNIYGIPPDLFKLAHNSLDLHLKNGESRLTRANIITYVDYRRPSSQKRLWTVDHDSQDLLFYEYVAHGKGKGRSGRPGELTPRVSNQIGSNLSSAGGFVTLRTRYSKAGQKKINGRKKPAKALIVDGLNQETNGNAKNRKILFHGAYYVSPERVGRSSGCFATVQSVNDKLVEAIKEGTFVFALF